MVDYLGPGAFGAARATASRPIVIPGANVSDPDTWAKDCSSPSARDGTEDRAGHMNAILAELRGLARSNGNRLSSAPVVADTNDGTMLAAAVVQLLQRDRARVCVAAGSANAITTSLQPALVELISGQTIRLVINAANNNNAVTHVTLNVNGLGVNNLTMSDGSVIPAGFLQSGEIRECVFDGTRWRLVHRLATETQFGVARLATTSEVANRTAGAVVTADKINSGIVVTGSAGVYSRALFFGKYAIMEGTNTFTGPGPHTLVLPEAFVNNGYGFTATSADGTARQVSASGFLPGQVTILLREANGAAVGAGQPTTIKWTSSSASV